jgi:hypothetical protein
MCTDPFAAAEAPLCRAGEDAAGEVAACCPPHAASMIAAAPRAAHALNLAAARSAGSFVGG